MLVKKSVNLKLESNNCMSFCLAVSDANNCEYNVLWSNTE